MSQLDVFGEMEAIDVGLEVGDVLREGDVIMLFGRESVVREGCQLFGGNEFGVVVGTVSESASNVIFCFKQACFYGRRVGGRLQQRLQRGQSAWPSCRCQYMLE